MPLKPEVSLGVAAATGALVLSVYQHALPSVADIRTAAPQDSDINGSRKMAAWTASGLVAGISLIAKDPTVFVVGGAIVVALDWWYRHADTVNPMLRGMTSGMSSQNQQAAPVSTSDMVMDY